MIEKRVVSEGAALVSLNYSLTADNTTRSEHLFSHAHTNMHTTLTRAHTHTHTHTYLLFTVAASVDGIQLLINLKFIKSLVSFLLESVQPLTVHEVVDLGTGEDEGEGEKEATPTTHHPLPVSSEGSVAEDVRETRIIVSAKIVRPLLALLEDTCQTSSHALVCQVGLL